MVPGGEMVPGTNSSEPFPPRHRCATLLNILFHRTVSLVRRAPTAPCPTRCLRLRGVALENSHSPWPIGSLPRTA